MRLSRFAILHLYYCLKFCRDIVAKDNRSGRLHCDGSIGVCDALIIRIIRGRSRQDALSRRLFARLLIARPERISDKLLDDTFQRFLCKFVNRAEKIKCYRNNIMILRYRNNTIKIICIFVSDFFIHISFKIN